MPTSRSSQPLSELVRLAWEGAAPGAVPNLLGLIEGAAARGSVSEAEIADACVEDAEQRMERGLACRLEHYLEAVPGHAGVGEVARAILMLECSARGSEGAEVVAEDLRQRFPAMLEHVGAVAEMMALMRAVGPVDAAPEIGIGTLLDEYRLEEWLGAGSFGEVWRAWDRTLERYVALKLIPSRGTEGATLAAVVREAKSAASIDHENVVRVFDAGRFDTANLCYIDTQLAGDPAPQAGDAKRVAVAKSLAALVAEGHRGKGMGAREGAALIGGVARGVAAAHARGIVHRDIKPSNIMVTPSGRPMVADFGLSALSVRTDGPGTDSGVVGHGGTTTAARTMGTGRITGTPAFMAPEQARGEAATPASDVFSLGATLRYVLTGRLPFAPSGRYSKDERWDVIEQVRRFECARLAVERPDLPKDLAAICDIAMAPEAKDRYLTAQAMADDLAAYLEGRPVSARPPGAVRATVMWANRNRSVVGLVLLMAVLGSAGLWRYIVNIGHERDRAVAAEAATAKQLQETASAKASAEAVNEFLQSVISTADPRMLGKDAKMLDAVRLASYDIEPRLRTQPRLEADVRAAVGLLYNTLDSKEEAVRNLNRALELRRASLGEDAAETLEVRHALLQVAADQEHDDANVLQLEGLLSQMRATIGADHRVTLGAEHSLLNEYGARHRFQEALDLGQHVLEVRRRTEGPDASSVLDIERSVAQLRFYMGDVDGGLASLESVADRYARTLGPDHFERYNTISGMSFCHRMIGGYEESANLSLLVLTGLTPQLPRGHVLLLDAAQEAANMLSMQLDRPMDAIAVYERVFLEYMEQSDKAPRRIAAARHVLGMCYLRAGRYPEALSYELKAREEFVTLIGNDDNDVVRDCDKILAQIYEGLGLGDKACEHRELSRGGAKMLRPRGQ